MIYISPITGETTMAVTFTLTHAGLDEEKVAVVGDFNNWDPHATAMDNLADGYTATVHVGVGRRYRFRYLAADGRWFNDEAAHDYQPNGFGGEDSVLDLTAHNPIAHNPIGDTPIGHTDPSIPEPARRRSTRAGSNIRSGKSPVG